MDLTAYKYSDAILPLKFNICGIELRPLSLGHLMILEKVNNPIIAQEVKEYNMADSLYWFFSALLTCGLSYEDNLIILNDAEKHKSLMDDFTVNLIKNMETDKQWNIYDKLNLYKQYMQYYMDMPIYTEERVSDNKIPSGTDWKQNMFLIFKKLGYGDSEIYNMNLRQLFYTWCSYAESEGGIKVMNKFDLQSMGRLN